MLDVLLRTWHHVRWMCELVFCQSSRFPESLSAICSSPSSIFSVFIFEREGEVFMCDCISWIKTCHAFPPSPSRRQSLENIFADLIFKISSPDILVCDKKWHACHSCCRWRERVREVDYEASAHILIEIYVCGCVLIPLCVCVVGL